MFNKSQSLSHDRETPRRKIVESISLSGDMAYDFLTREGEKYGDFVLVDCRPIDELKTLMRQLIHLPTGAQVMHLENDDPENLFCLSFKTLPDSSNGAAHILEHTVLCGSRKFPVKDPFFSMSRRSLNTFMNAMTGSDFTCYPASSQVEKDFYNLLEVYLDAVFHPLLKEQSFIQEGHRLGFKDPKDPSSPLEFKGIVYNEMKGAMSSVDSRIWQEMTRALIPDLPYAFNAGGDPKTIPSLTYKQLIDFHETYYHPSRCLFFFYGNFPLKKHLDFIDEHSLKGAERLSPIDGIAHQNRFESPVIEMHTYPTSETEDLDNKHIHTIGFLTTPLQSQDEVLALSILDMVLMDTDASPLKKALLDTKLCVHADCFLDTEMTEVPLIFIFRGCQKDGGEKLEKALFDALKKIADEGIPFHLIEAAIHQLEFSRTEMGGDHSPFGLTLFMRSALAKQHGCAPEKSLTVHALFEELIEKAKNPHVFTPLIEKYLLGNTHYARLSFAPDPDLSKKEGEEEQARLQQIREALTDEQIGKILKEAQELEEFQNVQEGQKLECLPKVTLLDVPAEARHFPLTSLCMQNFEIHHHDTFTNHILYADVICDLPHLTEKELFDLQLFLVLWPELGLGKRDYIENLEFVHAHTGGVGAHVSLHVQVEDPERIRPTLQLHGKALERKTDKLFSIFEEMLTVPRFDEIERIQELIKKLATSMQSRLSRNAMRYASQLALHGFSTPSHINEMWYGLSFYNKVQSLHQSLDAELPNLIDRLIQLKDKLLCVPSPTLILSCDQEIYDQLDTHGFYDLPKLKPKNSTPWESHYPLPEAIDQARIIASPVAFSAQGFKTISLGHEDAPALQIATILLDNKVLHHRIREQGGAYGSGAHYNPLWGNFYLYAYRDPHIARTFRTFRDGIHEIGDGNFDDRDLEEAKLGIVQVLDSPTSPGARAMSSYVMQRDGKTRQIRQTYRDQLLAMDKDSIQKAIHSQLLPQVHEGVFVTLAGKELLEKELPLLEERSIEPLPISPS